MTDISETAMIIERHLSDAGQGQRTGRRRRVNSVLAVALLAVVALSPLPLGSNRPFFWALSAAGLGLAATAYMLILFRTGEALRFPLRRLWAPAPLLLGLLGFLVVQLLPLAPAGGVAFATTDGGSVLSNTLSLAPGSTWLMLMQVLTYGLFFLLVLQVAVNRRRARTMGLAILFIVTAHALYALVALTLLDDGLLFFEKWAYAGFATGTFVNRNSFATFLAFGLVVGVVFALRETIGSSRGKERFGLGGQAPVYLACTGLILAALLASGSRMGLLAGLVGASCAAAMAARKRFSERGQRRWLLVAALPLAGAVAVAVLYGAGTLDRLGSLDTDANVRGDLYAQVLEMIAARPWLGYGGGTFELAYPLFHRLPVSPDLVWDKAHSSYLSLWVELGLIAGSVPLLIIAIFAVQALRLYLRRHRDWAASAAAFCVVLVAALHSLVDFSLEIQANVFILLAILAIGVAAAPTDADGAKQAGASRPAQ